MIREPGLNWSYNSNKPMLVGEIITRASGMSVMDFAKKHLFQPMGIGQYKWTFSPTRSGLTAGSFYMKPIDFLKVITLVKFKGNWKGKQIVSYAWIRKSTNCTIAIDFFFTRYSKIPNAQYESARYGFFWYRENLQYGNIKTEVLFSSGYCGQYMMYLPDYKTETMESTPLLIERSYAAPIEKLWKAITDAEQMKEWYFDLGDFKAEKGFKFQFTGGDEKVQYLHACEILVCDPPNKLSYSWTYPDYQGYSILTWELLAQGEHSTRLKLQHTGLESFPQGDSNFRRESFISGWNYFVNEALPAFVETDTIKKRSSIEADAEKIWDILLHPGNQWGKAFGDGAFAETDWTIGSTVIWTDPGGDIGSKGIVAAHRPTEYLQVDMFDDINAAPDAKPGEYSEKYRLSKIAERKFELEIECGPLAKKYLTQHEAMWDKAIELIKELAEKQS